MDISNVTDMYSMFFGCSNLIKLPDISKWNTENLENIGFLFYNCSKIMKIPDISKWNVNKIKIIDNLFGNCNSNLVLPDISKWNIKNTEIIKQVFNNNSYISNSITSINFSLETPNSANLSNTSLSSFHSKNDEQNIIKYEDNADNEINNELDYYYEHFYD